MADERLLSAVVFRRSRDKWRWERDIVIELIQHIFLSCGGKYSSSVNLQTSWDSENIKC